VALDPEPGLRIPNMLDAALDGSFRAIYIQGEDILQSDPNTHHVAGGLKAMDCVIVHDLFLNETANYAHVFLPGSTFLEKDGTFTNAERRIQLVRKVMEPANGYADWEVTQELANAMGLGWNYATRRDHGRDRPPDPDFRGRIHARLEAEGSLQWPVNDAAPDGSPIMHVDGFVRGKGKFMVTDYVPTDEKTGPRYPLLLTTGRIVLSQYNVGAQTRRTENTVWHPKTCSKSTPPMPKTGASRRRLGAPRQPHRRNHAARRGDRPGRAGRGLYHLPPPATQANVVTTDYSDWATNCPEYKVTAVQVLPSNGPSDWQESYASWSEKSRRIALRNRRSSDAWTLPG
jgi:formate dehydrogenase major subunit